jgi:hypothetical protein
MSSQFFYSTYKSYVCNSYKVFLRTCSFKNEWLKMFEKWSKFIFFRQVVDSGSPTAFSFSTRKVFRTRPPSWQTSCSRFTLVQFLSPIYEYGFILFSFLHTCMPVCKRLQRTMNSTKGIDLNFSNIFSELTGINTVP